MLTLDELKKTLFIVDCHKYKLKDDLRKLGKLGYTVSNRNYNSIFILHKETVIIASRLHDEIKNYSGTLEGTDDDKQLYPATTLSKLGDSSVHKRTH